MGQELMSSLAQSGKSSTPGATRRTLSTARTGHPAVDSHRRGYRAYAAAQCCRARRWAPANASSGSVPQGM